MTASDIPAVRSLYESMGFEYEFPNLLAQEFVDVTVVEDNGTIVMATAARKTVEVYLFIDGSWKTPGWRHEVLMQVHLAVHKRLKWMGFSDAHCWIPPQVAKSFGKRLQRVFGWNKSVWEVFSKRL